MQTALQDADVPQSRENELRRLNDVRTAMQQVGQTGEQVLADTSDEAFRERYRILVADAETALHRTFAGNGIRDVVLMTNEPYEHALKRFFKGLSARRGHARVL